MLCDQCRERQAAVNLTNVRAGVVTSAHLCEVCARSRGVSLAPTSVDSPGAHSVAGRLAALAATLAEAEASANPEAIARLVAYLDWLEREHPEAAMPSEVRAFRERHRSPPTA